MRTVIAEDATAAGAMAADLILDALERVGPSERFLLGCPGGRTPRTTYQALAAEALPRELDLSNVVIVMMDDYVEMVDGRPRRVDPKAQHSCERFGRREIVDVLNRGLPPQRRVDPANLWLPDPANPQDYDDRIAAAGGVDVFLLASGASDGHIAFNPAGSPADSRTRVVSLAESTRQDNLATFPSFGGNLDAVPTLGVTVGLGTIRDQTRRAVMVIHGRDKRLAAARVAAAARHHSDWPATIVAECRDAHVVLDRSAASDPELLP